jgi:amino acid adenylation domain-containing protein
MAMRPVAAETSIAERFRDVAATFPGELALISARARYTYAELDRWSDAIAADLVAAGAPANVPVAIVIREPLSLVPASLAVVKAGNFFVVLDAGDSDERIAAILNATGAALCLVDSVPPAATRHLSLLRMRALPDAPVEPITQPPHELVQLVFTSGTTGVPKAVASPQRGFVERMTGSSTRTGRAAGERVSYTAIPGHARASGEIFGSLLNGATLCAFDARSESLDALGDLIARERISTLTLTPALFRRFLRALPATADLSSIRKLRLGADVITVADVDVWRTRFPRTATLERAFNSTETGTVLHLTIDHDTPIPGPLVPLGRPIPGVEVWLVDEEGRVLTGEETGELVVRSAQVAHGYWNVPELTAQKFTFDPEHPDTPAFHTGDLLRRDADGLYYFIGRRDARLKIHGRRIDPVEVESALIVHAGAREAVAFAEPAPDGELHLAAYVVMKDPTSAPRDIRAALRDRVPAWMIPARIHVVDDLPMTRAGKVDRAALASRPLGPRPSALSPAAKPDDLRAIWSRILGTPVAPDDDFFDDLGGSSLAAAEIVAEVNRVTGYSLPLSLLLELNTVRKMAGYLHARPALERTVIALQTGGALPPLFCVSGKGGSVIRFRPLSALLGADQPFYGLTHHGFDPRSFPPTLGAVAAAYADAVRATQPAGPYYLAGYSAGGFIAYELARQLALGGEQVAFVGLIDTAATRTHLTPWKRYRKQLTILRHRPAATTARYARALARRTEWLGRWLRTRGREPFAPRLSQEIRDANRFFESLEIHAALKPWSGPVTVFLARHGRGADAGQPDGGWSALCGDSLTVIPIDGEHDTILDEDVHCLAEPFARALENARRG